MKGFGRSPKPEDRNYSVYEQVRLVLMLIRKLDIKRLILVGHSFGGGAALITSLYLTFYDEGRFERLILLDSPAYEQELPPFVYLLRIPFISDLGSSLISAEMQIRSVLKASYLDGYVITDDVVMAYSVPLDERGGKKALIETARLMVPGDLSELGRMYPQIEVPTLILWGDSDETIPLEIGQRLAKTIPNSRLELISRCGHVPQEENPEETTKMMREFLEID